MSQPVVIFVMALMAVVVITGVTTIVYASFNSSLDTDGNTSTIESPASQIFDDGVALTSNFAGQLGTVGTIAGVLLLLMLIAFAGIYGYQKYK